MINHNNILYQIINHNNDFDQMIITSNVQLTPDKSLGACGPLDLSGCKADVLGIYPICK